MSTMSQKTIDFFFTDNSVREKLRRRVVEKFLEENPGTGSGNDASKYRYNVETLSDGSSIYLTRPAYLKKGFDFRISVEGRTFLTGKDYPKHDDIFNDLRDKKNESAENYGILHKAMDRVYNCEDPTNVLRDYSDLRFDVGYPVELILKVLKWFFIEQDIRDWNYSGRMMFKKGLDDILG